jgi:hypothetical protein
MIISRFIAILVSCQILAVGTLYCSNSSPKETGSKQQTEGVKKQTNETGSTLVSPAFPLENLFGVWTLDLSGPHADFRLDEESYFIVDYDGDGSMRYDIIRDSIIVHFEGYSTKGRILKAQNDSLAIAWDGQEPTVYFRWKE